jgi:hypothetical protein
MLRQLAWTHQACGSGEELPSSLAFLGLGWSSFYLSFPCLASPCMSTGLCSSLQHYRCCVCGLCAFLCMAVCVRACVAFAWLCVCVCGCPQTPVPLPSTAADVESTPAVSTVLWRAHCSENGWRRLGLPGCERQPCPCWSPCVQVRVGYGVWCFGMGHGGVGV